MWQTKESLSKEWQSKALQSKESQTKEWQNVVHPNALQNVVTYWSTTKRWQKHFNNNLTNAKSIEYTEYDSMSIQLQSQYNENALTIMMMTTIRMAQ